MDNCFIVGFMIEFLVGFMVGFSIAFIIGALPVFIVDLILCYFENNIFEVWQSVASVGMYVCMFVCM